MFNRPAKISDEERLQLKIRSASYLENIIIPIIKTFTRQKIKGYHGIEHTELVAFRAVDIALSEGYKDFRDELLPLLLAAALHDSARTDDAYNETHGPDAATRLETQNFLDEPGFMLTPFHKIEIKSAVAKHTSAMPSLFKKYSYIQRCLCDADRIRLSWEHGYNSKYFFTKRGRQLACMSPDEIVTYLSSWQKLLKTNKIKNVGRPILQRYEIGNYVRFTEPENN